MKLSEQLELIARIHTLVRMKATGTPTELSQRLSISKRTLYRILDFLKHDVHAPLEYSVQRKTYFYFSDGELVTLKWIPETKHEEIKPSKNGIPSYSSK